jgi:hypothetical protein
MRDEVGPCAPVIIADSLLTGTEVQLLVNAPHARPHAALISSILHIAQHCV